MIKSLLAKSMLISFVFLAMISPKAIQADVKKEENIKFCREKSIIQVVKTVRMIVTAYSSDPNETDDTPLITASGKHVEDGYIANNMLRFGTKVRIPSLYGNKIFTVEDRMHKRKGYYMADVWKESKQAAKEAGAELAEVEVLES